MERGTSRRAEEGERNERKRVTGAEETSTNIESGAQADRPVKKEKDGSRHDRRSRGPYEPRYDTRDRYEDETEYDEDVPEIKEEEKYRLMKDPMDKTGDTSGPWLDGFGDVMTGLDRFDFFKERPGQTFEIALKG